MDSQPQLISREVFEAQQLVDSFPPKWADRNKKAVYRIACPTGCEHHGAIEFSRWTEASLPDRVEKTDVILESREGAFGYEPTTNQAVVEWYLNFAHFDLFCAYAGPLFAQDEMQVAEHPALGSIREALLVSTTSKPLTVENGRPTPVLIRGVERRCVVATDRNEAEGRPHGLYGMAFSRAPVEAVERATRPILPPTITNLIAIEAPSYGTGLYTYDQLRFILSTAFTGFHAATVESTNEAKDRALPVEVVIHTGFWGCGAYGGDRVLMALLQIAAVRLAGIHRLVFHAFDRAGTKAFAKARQIFEEELQSAGSVTAMLLLIQRHGFRWGESDGN